jgi:hypothetical protein
MARSAGCALCALAAPRSMTGVVPPRSGRVVTCWGVPLAHSSFLACKCRLLSRRFAGGAHTLRAEARPAGDAPDDPPVAGASSCGPWARRLAGWIDSPAALVTRAGSDDNDVVGVADDVLAMEPRAQLVFERVWVVRLHSGFPAVAPPPVFVPDDANRESSGGATSLQRLPTRKPITSAHTVKCSHHDGAPGGGRVQVKPCPRTESIGAL